MNHMIHNLTPTPTDVYITYDLDFVPDTAPEAAGDAGRSSTLWMDVMGVQAYPVFDVARGAGGKDGQYTYPDGESHAAPAIRATSYIVPQDGVLVGTAGHLHPGGLYTDLYVSRAEQAGADLFRSRAKYFEPAGAVSWDVAMDGDAGRTGESPSSRATCSTVTATYDIKRASWYESMGIMPLDVHAAAETGAGPVHRSTSTRAGMLTHGHLRENRNHGGGCSPACPTRGGCCRSRRRRSRPSRSSDFLYAPRRPELRTGKAGRPPTVRRGRSLKFVNRDASARAILHTITVLQGALQPHDRHRLPARQRHGRRSTRATSASARRASRPAANRDTWTTPQQPQAGHLHVLLPVHPFMRGAFRVKARAEHREAVGRRRVAQCDAHVRARRPRRCQASRRSRCAARPAAIAAPSCSVDDSHDERAVAGRERERRARQRRGEPLALAGRGGAAAGDDRARRRSTAHSAAGLGRAPTPPVGASRSAVRRPRRVADA